MEKSILITGKQASGKTTKAYEILSNFDSEKTEMLCIRDFLQLQINDIEKFDAVCIDEIIKVEQIAYIVDIAEVVKTKMIITTQMELVAIPKCLQKSFEIIQVQR